MENLKDLEQELEIDELDDFELSEGTQAFEVWLEGYSKDGNSIWNYKIEDYEIKEEALKCAEYFSDKMHLEIIENNDETFEVSADVYTIQVCVILYVNNLLEDKEVYSEFRV